MNIKKNKLSKTKEKLLITAIELFGKFGYDATSTRELVEKANVNISAITYHFGGKKELYEACAYYIIDQLKNDIKPVTDKADILIENDNNDLATWRKLFEEFIALEVGVFTSSKRQPICHLFIREQLNPTGVSTIFYEDLVIYMKNYSRLMISKLLGEPINSEIIQMKSLTFSGMLQLLVSSKVIILEDFNLEGYNSEFTKKYTGYIMSIILD